MTLGRGSVLLLGCAVGAATAHCASDPAQPSDPPRPPPPTASTTAAAAAMPTPTQSASASASATYSPPPPPRFATAHVLDFTRELEGPIASIGIGQPRVAVLSDDPWIKEGDGWRKVPIPERLRPAAGERQEVRIFFGRDDRPRIMGWRSDASGGNVRGVYLRHMRDGWHAERAEIGRLSGNPPGALFGVLGHDDPEVVCKVADICIIKRRTGWQTIDAPAGRPRVELCGKQAWAVHADHLARATDAGWQRLPGDPPWRDPDGFWAASDSDLWVTVGASEQLHRFDGAAWTSQPSPVQRPRALWASAPDSVWLVGDSGAAHFDGTAWRRVKGVEGPLTHVRGAGADDVYLGGPKGLLRGTKR